MTQLYAPQSLGGGWRAWSVLAGQMAVTAVLVSALPGFIVWQTWAEARALEVAWTVRGPPCDVVETPASWAVSHRQPARSFTYGGATFTRQFAAVSCAAVPEDWWWPRESYHVCMFNNPGAVTVSTLDGPVTFQPPYGQRATVTVRRGAASCVVGGRFNL